MPVRTPPGYEASEAWQSPGCIPSRHQDVSEIIYATNNDHYSAEGNSKIRTTGPKSWIHVASKNPPDIDHGEITLDYKMLDTMSRKNVRKNL